MNSGCRLLPLTLVVYYSAIEADTGTCYGLGESSRIHIWKFITKVAGLRGGASRRWLDHEGKVLMKGIHSLVKTPEAPGYALLILSATIWGTVLILSWASAFHHASMQQQNIWEAESSSHPTENPQVLCSWTFSLYTMRNKFGLFIN